MPYTGPHSRRPYTSTYWLRLNSSLHFNLSQCSMIQLNYALVHMEVYRVISETENFHLKSS